MRRLIYSVAMSLDGYIAGPNGEYDWIVMDPEIDFGALMARFDTLIMGRRTFEAAAGSGGGGAMSGLRSYVASRTLTTVPKKIALLRDAVAGVDELRAAPGKDIWLFGGGDLFRSLLEAGRVDAVEVAVIPAMIGGGRPVLPEPAAGAKLRLSDHRIYGKTGTVWLTYDVVREGPGRIE